MSVIGIIPVRIKSSRLPNKPTKRIDIVSKAINSKKILIINLYTELKKN